MRDEQAIPITQLVRRMRNALEISVGELWVEGEVSNLRRQASGHAYFSLKDSSAQIPCAMFGARRKKGGELLEDGLKVKAFVEVTLYEPRGVAQLVVREVKVSGQGNLQARFEELKARLNAEGLFDPTKKRQLPKFPKRVGIVTSPTGAALQDILNVLQRRAPWVETVVYPVVVQGAGAEQGIADAIDEFSNWEACGRPEVDVIIVGRGGGSIEDLWNFNEEVVARAIHRCGIPLVSAVGHEIDFTISDFAADVRAPTPSAAAELVVPDRDELLARVAVLGQRLNSQTRQRVNRLDERLADRQRGLRPEALRRFLRDRAQRVDVAESDLLRSVKDFQKRQRDRLEAVNLRRDAMKPLAEVERLRNRLEQLVSLMRERTNGQLSHRLERVERLRQVLEATGPNAVLARGFSMTLDDQGRLITSVHEAAVGTQVVTRLHDGELTAKILSKKSDEE